MEIKKIILKLDLHCDKMKQKAMTKVSGLLGVESISMDMKDGKMTVIGTADPVCIVEKLRKRCQIEVVSVGPAKEPEKKEPPKKQENKEDKKIPEEVVFYPPVNVCCYCGKIYGYPYMTSHCCCYVGENPNSCVIC